MHIEEKDRKIGLDEKENEEQIKEAESIEKKRSISKTKIKELKKKLKKKIKEFRICKIRKKKQIV